MNIFSILHCPLYNVVCICKKKTFAENEIKIFSLHKKKKIFWRLNRSSTKRYFKAKRIILMISKHTVHYNEVDVVRKRLQVSYFSRNVGERRFYCVADSSRELDFIIVKIRSMARNMRRSLCSMTPPSYKSHGAS